MTILVACYSISVAAVFTLIVEIIMLKNEPMTDRCHQLTISFIIHCDDTVAERHSGSFESRLQNLHSQLAEPDNPLYFVITVIGTQSQ